MRHTSLLTSPKMEEQSQPNPEDTIDECPQTTFMHELDSVLGMEDDEMCGWDFMGWNFLSINNGDVEDGHGDEMQKAAGVCNMESQKDHGHMISIKEEVCDQVWENYDDDDDEKKLCLNLSLNHQNVLDAWSDRGPLWADDNILPSANNAYMGEVPVMEEERTRREASVLRYKEKRLTRLFSKKIRYQVRKLNADKRPRIKGRFVKRVAEVK